MKRIPVTIRAAYIGGVFTLVAVILAFILNLQIRPKNPRSLNEYAKGIIQSYFGYKNIKIDNEDIVWFDFASKGTKKEFYVTYFNGQKHVVDVFTTRQGFPESLFHRLGEPAYEQLGATHVTFNNKTYFICTLNEGMGLYLNLSIFEYDGVGKPRLVQKLPKEYGLYKGKMFVVDNKVYINGDNKILELKYNNGNFFLEPYKNKLSHEPGSGSHVLSYNLINGGLQIIYDGEPIQFAELHGNYFSTNPIRLNYDEQIFVDDNLINAPSQGIRLLVDEGLSYYPGLFATIRPTKRGKTELAVSHDSWYNIEVVIK